MIPFYVSVPRALRSFKLRSLPKTLFSTFAVISGLKKKLFAKNVVLTFSISPDYARVWYFFARKNLPNWSIVIVDCAGTMQQEDFPGAEVVKFANLAHGTKIDIFLKKYLHS